jgi:hypothetical protein
MLVQRQPAFGRVLAEKLQRAVPVLVRNAKLALGHRGLRGSGHEHSFAGLYWAGRYQAARYQGRFSFP